MFRTLSRFAIALVTLGLSAMAAALPPGTPPLTELKPDVEVYPQIFGLAQDSEARLYLGNSDGALAFDGESWQLVGLPNGDLVRSLAHDPASDRIYVGGFNCFGYIDRDPTGQARYHDLTGLFAGLLKGEEFADVWAVRIAGEGVLFRALRHVFLYVPGAADGAPRLWRHAGRFGAIIEYQDRVILQFRGEGLRHLSAGEWLPLPGTSSLKDLVSALVPLPDGGLLTLANDGLWQRYADGRLTPFAMPDGMPPSSSFSSGIQLEDGTLALPASNGMLYLVDTRRRTLRSLRLSFGYLSEVKVAADGGLLVTGPISAFHVRWPSDWTLLAPSTGAGGSIYRTAQWGRDWYALTGDGVKRLGEDSSLQALDWSRNETWDLLCVDADTALLAESYALLLIERGQVRALTHNAFYPRIVRRLPSEPDIFLIGAESGFGILRHAGNDSWSLLLDASDMDDIDVTGFVADGRRKLWLGSARSGLAHVSLAEDFSRILELRRYNEADGIEYGTQADAIPVRLADGRLIVSTGAGFFEVEHGRFQRTDVDGLEALRADGETLRLTQAPDGVLWAHSYRNIYRRDTGGWHAESVHGLAHGAIESLTFTSQGQALFSSGDGILRHESRQNPVPGNAPHVLLTSVEQHAEDGEVTALSLDSGTPLILPAGGWSLVLRFALPDLSQPDAVRYQWRLSGAQTRYSDWSSSTTLNYSRLGPGDYRLEVNGRDSQGRISSIAPLSMRILAPWYARSGMIALWVLLALALAAVLTLRIVQVRTRRLQSEHVRLERVVAQRTAELETANQRLDNMAHLDGLTGIANRRRLDDALPAAWDNSLQRQRPLSLLIIDVDHFKDYNDSNGHLAGDALLSQLGRVLQSSLRRSEDLLARYGGDEFFVVLPGADSTQAMDVASHMRELIASIGLGATVSIGTATLTPSANTQVTDLIDRADAALYAAKKNGRNRIAAHGDS